MNVYDEISVNTHVVAESSKLKATTAGHIYNLEAATDTDNGAIVTLGDFVGGDVYEADTYAAGKMPLLVLTAPSNYNTALKRYSEEKYFYNKAGEIMRAYELVSGDVFTVSEDAITRASGATSITVGNYVGVVNGMYQESATAGQTGFVGQIVEKVNYQHSVSYRILVVTTGC